MAALPRFAFPSPRHSAPTDTKSDIVTDTLRKEKPQISLHTPSKEEQESRLVPCSSDLMPETLTTISTPPDSPTRQRSYTMSASPSRTLRDSGAVTPPPTPTASTHCKSQSASSLASSLSNLRRGDSTSSRTRPRRDTSEESEKPGSTQPRKFPHWLSDYEIEVDGKGKKKLLGSGLWSDVYLAKPCSPKPVEQAPLPTAPGAEMTPPITPVRSRTASLSKGKLPQVALAYAIKVPASRSAKQVLGEESRILSYLTRFPDAEKYIVPYYGQDTRTEALVLQAMDGTLEGWVQKDLNTMPEPGRAARLAEVFPAIASHLLDGLIWMQEKGCTHADIKPSNMLVTGRSSTSTPHILYSDFSSAILPALQTEPQTKPRAPLGGGTWDFLDPSLIFKSSSPAPPSAQTDLWSLAITLLSLVIGASPFDCAGANHYRRREFIKQGIPLSYTTYGDDGPRNLTRITTLSKHLGLDIRTWFAKVLHKDIEKRVGLQEWREELVQAVAQAGSKI